MDNKLNKQVASCGTTTTINAIENIGAYLRFAELMVFFLLTLIIILFNNQLFICWLTFLSRIINKGKRQKSYF